jgi:hypothetical protein
MRRVDLNPPYGFNREVKYVFRHTDEDQKN